MKNAISVLNEYFTTIRYMTKESHTLKILLVIFFIIIILAILFSQKINRLNKNSFDTLQKELFIQQVKIDSLKEHNLKTDYIDSLKEVSIRKNEIEDSIQFAKYNVKIEKQIKDAYKKVNEKNNYSNSIIYDEFKFVYGSNYSEE